MPIPMSHIIQDFSKWKKLNEQDVPGREREHGSNSNKVVAIPVDKNTLKLKVVNDADVIDGDGRLTIDGFDSILTWIKSQGEIINYYTALNDLTNNIVVYSINKDNDRKQVIIFKIYSKNALKAQDPSSAGINSQVRFVRQDELTKALSGAILNTKSLQNIASQPSAGLKFPFPTASILGSADQNVINFIILAYNKVRKDPQVAASAIMPKVKAEAQAKKLGATSQLFIKALNAGFAVADNEFPEDIETDITKMLYDKVSYIPEAESSVIKGFDVDAFLAVANSAQVATGDIKVPEGGFREGMQNNPELKKFQDLLAKKFARHLANHATYQAFKKAGAKGYLGNYGPLTSALVKLLKMIAEDPKYPNNDGTTIEPEFVNMVQQVNESTSKYIGLDGISLIIESTFNFSNADTISPGLKTQDTQDTATAVKRSKEYSDLGNSFTYRVEGGFWTYKNGSTWTKVANAVSIKKLMEKHPKSESGGNYVIVPASGYDETWAKSKAAFIYRKTGDGWEYSTPGPAGWTKVADSKSIEYLNKFYGGSSSSNSTTTSKSSTPTVGKLGVDQFAKIKPKIEAAIESAGLTNKLSEVGVNAQIDGITWKFTDFNNSYKLDTTGTISGKDKENKQFISGKLSTDYSKVVLSSGVAVSLKEFLRRTTSADLTKRKISDIRIAELAGKLDTALMRTNTDENMIMAVYKNIKTYSDLVALHKQFDKITGTEKTLLAALNGDLDDSEWDDLMYILDDNGLLGTTIGTRSHATGYGKMYAIAKSTVGKN